ncbi:MAG TPA: 6-phosphogluconate dehydrogenase [Flavobacterium sp.]|nr:6-phosphogluconate dehydrogenase [Flavobacterium sp.]
MLRKIILYVVLFLGIFTAGYFAFLYNASYSEGLRSGELIKFSNKGVVFKTWEGELSQGLSGNKIFAFSVLDNDTQVIEDLKNLQGQYVKATYVERYRTFPWWGETRYFVTKVEKEKSPIFGK